MAGSSVKTFVQNVVGADGESRPTYFAHLKVAGYDNAMYVFVAPDLDSLHLRVSHFTEQIQSPKKLTNTKYQFVLIPLGDGAFSVYMRGTDATLAVRALGKKWYAHSD